jgi:energy-converting hydrogenase Eha subunit H
MKETIKREQNKLIIVYGTVLFTAGLIGTIFPESSEFIIRCCFIFGFTSMLTGLGYFAAKKMNQTAKKNK